MAPHRVTDSGRFAWAPPAAALCATLVGGAVTLGWTTGWEGLTRPGPGAITIKPTTAAGFIALGIALRLLAREGAGGASRAMTVALGTGAAFLGLLTLAEYAAGWDPGFDRLLFHDRVVAEGVKYPGRMSESSAVDFALLGSAVVLGVLRPKLARTLQGLALAAGVIALFALIAYWFDAAVHMPWMGDFTPLTPTAAVVFMSLALGLALIRPDTGFMFYITTSGPGGAMARILLPIAAAVPILFGGVQLRALRRGWASVEMIVTLRTLATMLALFVFIWISARVSFRLNAIRIGALNDAAALLAAANLELDGFARSVSHDLRAPVRAVDGFAQLLEEQHAGQLDPEGRRLLGVVRRSSRQMGQLIDDLLAFSRISRQAREHVHVAMHAMAGAVAAEACAAEPARTITVDMGELPEIDGDRSMLRQVWANLLSNAVKYTRGRSAALIRVTGDVRDGFARYAVSDNGAGFDPRYQDKLFGVFQRLHSAEEFEGTGVGLALVKRIVERHGGSVGAEGRPGAGATFTFALPLSRLEGKPA